MTIGTSIVLIAIGAILYYALGSEAQESTADVINLGTVGVILMILGVLGLVLSLIYMFYARGRADREVVRDAPREREVVRDREPRDRF